MDPEKPSEPDSTTAEREVAETRQFRVNDEVLCHISKGDQHYLGNIIQVNNVLKKCLVKFLDDTETWCNFTDMKFLSMPAQEVTCVVCKSANSKNGSQIKVCACGRGYHQHCHKPHIPIGDEDWRCKICSPMKRRDLDRTVKQTIFTPIFSNNVDAPLKDVERQQCSCGRLGVWYRSMLQCRRCNQWFHSECVRSLDQPVFSGDRFYVFICAGCNRGKEFCVRLSLTWPDLVHLVFFNLLLVNSSKYYDLDQSIMPFLNSNWRYFNLPPEIDHTPIEKRRVEVRGALLGCEKKFKCGRESKKKATWWGLKVRGAPRPPPVSLPPKGAVDEQSLRLQLRRHMLLPKEKPLQNGFVNSSRKDFDAVPSVKVPSECKPVDVNGDAKVVSSSDYHGCGLVKRSVPFPLTEQAGNADARFRSQAVRRAARLLRRRKPPPPAEKRKRTPSDDESEEVDVENDDDDDDDDDMDSPPSRRSSSSHESKSGAKPVITPPPNVIRKRPQRNLLEARLNSTESKLYNPQAEAEETKEKKRTSAGETNAKKKVKKTENGTKKSDKRLVQKTILETFQQRKSDSKVSENGHSLSNSSRLDESGTSGDDFLVKPPVKAVIKKRKLSEKDIVVDRNGQVRRKRRTARPRGTAATPSPSTTPSIPPPIPSMAPTVMTLDQMKAKYLRPFMDFELLDSEAISELFGARDRIAKGEKYDVLARRILPSGRVEVMFDFPNASPPPS